MPTVYERLLAGETLRVQFAGQPGYLHKGPFTLGPLWMIGDFYVTEKSKWKQFADIGGITINKRRRQRMSPCEMETWCGTVELMEENKHD